MQISDLTIRDIFRSANKSFGVDNVLANTRKQEYVYARHAVAYYLHKVCKLTQIKSGQIINKEHATIIHSVKTHSALMQYNKEYKAMYLDMYERLKPKKHKRWLCKEMEFKIIRN